MMPESKLRRIVGVEGIGRKPSRLLIEDK